MYAQFKYMSDLKAALRRPQSLHGAEVLNSRVTSHNYMFRPCAAGAAGGQTAATGARGEQLLEQLEQGLRDLHGGSGPRRGRGAQDELSVRARGGLEPDAAARGLVLDSLRAEAAYPRPAELHGHPGHVPRRALLPDAAARARRRRRLVATAVLRGRGCRRWMIHRRPLLQLRKVLPPERGAGESMSDQTPTTGLAFCSASCRK